MATLYEASTHNPADIGKGRKPVLPPPGQQWTQAQVHYEPSVAIGGCAKCKHYDPRRGQCEVVAGFVQADGCCDYFNLDQFPPPPVTKFDAGYVRVPGAAYQCGDCEFWANGGCQIVQGKIDPGGACWEWAGVPGEVGSDKVAAATADNIPNEAPIKGGPDMD